MTGSRRQLVPAGLLAAAIALSGCAEVPAGLWPADRTALVFCYAENIERVGAVDADGQAAELHTVSAGGLMSRGRAFLDRNGVMLLGRGSYAARSAGPIAAAMARSGAFTIEACITPDAAPGEARRTFLSLEPAGAGGPAGVALGQRGKRLTLTFRTAGAAGRTIDLSVIEPGVTTHVAVTYRPGRLTCYRNGRRGARVDANEPFAARGAYRLILGDTYAGGSDWAGMLEGVALYARELSDSEVRRNCRARMALARKRPTPPVIRIRATLLARSDPPRAGASPYYRALAISHYRVDKVIKSIYEQPEILVAHWARWRNSLLPFCELPLGQSVELIVEPFDAAGRHVTREFVSITLDDELFDLPWYYDAGLISLTGQGPKPSTADE